MQLVEHKHYFNRLANRNKLAVVSLLVPSFIVGWESAKRVDIKQGLKQMTKLGFSSVLNSMRKLYLGI